MNPLARRTSMIGAQLAFAIALLLLWHAYTTDPQRAFSFGTPSATWHHLTNWISDGSIWRNTGATLAAALAGYVFATVVGTVVGVCVGMSRYLDEVFSPFFSFWNGFPRMVYYPFFSIVLGYTFVSRAALVAFVIIFMVVANTAAGVRETDPVVVENMRTLGARRWELVRVVFLPSAAVWILTSARLTVGWALQSAIFAEFIGATSGLGYLTISSQNSFDSSGVWASTFVVVVLAIVVDRALLLVQRRMSRWMPARS